MTQLDLFNGQSPTLYTGDGIVDGAPPNGATILPFPQERNIGKARHVAARLLRRPQGNARDAYWVQVCNRMIESMLRANLTAEESEHQVRRFRDAVSLEMGRMMAACGQGGADERYS